VVIDFAAGAITGAAATTGDGFRRCILHDFDKASRSPTNDVISSTHALDLNQ